MSFLHLDPWKQVSKLRIGPSSGNKNRAAVLARIPVKFDTGGEGKVGKMMRSSSRTFWWPWLGERLSGGDSSTANSDGRRRGSAARMLRRSRVEEEWPGSYARARWS